MSKCPHCGAEVQYKPDTKKVHCEYCGSDFKVSELLQQAKMAKEKELLKEEMKKEDAKPKISGKAYSCTQCGATLLSFDETAVTFCSYCGSQNMIEEKTMKQTAPELIIPFQKTQEECINNFKKKVNHFIFSPKYMKSDLVVKKFRGIYMPYGIYHLSHQGNCTNMGEKYSHRSGDYLYYDKYVLNQEVDATYKGISYDLLSKFYDEYSMAIPFDYRQAVEFNSNYLPGFYADAKDVDMYTYRQDATTLVDHDAIQYLKKDGDYLKYGCSSPTIHFGVSSEKTGFFPVYFASIRDKDDKHIHYAIINGQTGKVAADLPVDFMKYLLFSLALFVPIFILINLLVFALPTSVNLFALVMGIIGFIIFTLQLSACNEREGRYSDKGYSSSLEEVDENGKKIKRKRVNKYKMTPSFLIKSIIAVFVPLGTIFFNPVHDYYYYVSAMISLTFVILSFRDLVKIHNILVSRPIPQLEKRGGDESGK